MKNLLDANLTGTLDVSALTNKAAVRAALEITESGDGPWISEQPDLGGSLSVAEGIAFHAVNSTLAAVGAQQVSPAVLWTGAGWKTVATAASQAVTFRAYISPNQGTSNPSGNWTLQSSINGGAFANSLVFSSAGQLDVPGGLNVAGLTALDGPVTAETPGATITLSPEDAAVILAPPGTGTVTINPGTTGSINNMAAALTTLSLTGALTLPDNVRQTFNPGATVAGLNVGSQAGDPSTPINGDVWYDSIANTLDARINGATVILGTGDPPPPPFDPASPGPIGGTAPGAGAFTTLSASEGVNFGGATIDDLGQAVLTNLSVAGDTTLVGLMVTTDLQAPSIGNFTPGTGAFTTLSATGGFKLGADAATPVTPQIISAGNASAGTGTTVQFSAGTGTVAGGALVFRTAATGTLTDRLTITAAGAATFSGSVSATSFAFAGSGYIYAPGNGVVKLSDAADTGFNRLQFGGTTSSFPAIKRSTTKLQMRLADDSAYTAFDVLELQASGTKVVGAQGAAVADATDNPTAITQLNALLAQLRTHGLIAT